MGLTLSPVRGASRKRQKPKRPFRPDIQGLRAFAVTVVIIDHLFSWPSGGFIGVDVFFVISGFLITGHLLREYGRTGRISFSGFYRKRIKRIMPAAVLVLVSTVGAAWIIFTTARFQDTVRDAVWGLLFGANWHFGLIGTDYFQAGGPVSPLQHYWSLAVEEQFYFVWPWLMLGAFALFLRGRAGGREKTAAVVAGAIILVISTVSFCWALQETAASPGLAYFSTFSRGWELGLGALFAVLSPVLSRIPMLLRPLLAWAGLIGLFSALFLISEESLFPAPAAALPVLATGAVIAAGTGARPHWSLFLLTNRATDYVGDISYSLYLWHFPVIILVGALMPAGGLPYYLMTVVAIIVTSVFAYHLVEDPIRRSSWLDRAAGGRNSHDPVSTTRYRDTALAFLAVVTVAFVAWAIVPKPAATDAALISATSGLLEKESGNDNPAYGPELDKLQAEIQRALAARAWPRNLSPSVDQLGFENWRTAVSADSCVDVDQANLAKCKFNAPRGHKKAVLLGDSYAMAWTAGLREALFQAGYSLQLLTLQQCPAADVAVLLADGGPYPACGKHRDWAVDTIKQTKPDLLIMASADGTVDRLASKAQGDDARKEYAAGTKATIEAVRHQVGKVLVLGAPPRGENLQECVTKVSKPADCDTSPLPGWEKFISAEKAAAASAKASFVDTRLWFCTPAGHCPAFVGSTPVRTDAQHLTVEYSNRLAKVIKTEVLDKL